MTKMKGRSLLFIIIFAVVDVCQATTFPRSKFKAAVYEHKVILPKYSNITVSRQEALSLMYKNLKVYGIQTEAAVKQNADIIVFPEDGIYGMMFRDRKYVKPYLERIPDPRTEDCHPCTDPELPPNTEIQSHLSCLAMNNSIYLVANMGDIQPCDVTTDPHCPPDGHYQFNTDVVFDPNGTLVAKYHKENLFLENQFDKPKKVEFVHFDTPFGKFGVFTCFDILFRNPPITLIERYGVGNIVFPTAWMDALPLLAAIQFHSSFAVKMGVNLLAANIHLPAKTFHGSGIYTPDVNAAYYYNNSLSSPGKLLISEINVVAKTPNMIWSDESVNQTSQRTEFQAVIFHDLYNFVHVQGTGERRSVCHNKLCCHLKFEKEDNKDDHFALGAFDGLHVVDGHYYLQVCTLLRCANSTQESCGRPVLHFRTKFSYLRIDGSFGTPYVFPSVLLTEDGQPRLAPKQWHFKNLVLESTTAFDLPLLSANLFGRLYDKDDDTDDNGGSSYCCACTWSTVMLIMVFTVVRF